MSSTSNSTRTFDGIDVPYVGCSGRDRNPFTIASVGSLWEMTDIKLDVKLADKVNTGLLGNPRHEITFAYLAPSVKGVKDPALAGTPDQRTKVETTIKEWERYAHVSFVHTDVMADATIRISFDPADGNWSLVGAQHVAFVGGDEKTMNLGGLKRDGALAEDYERHVILHEFGHSLGLLHEHQSPAREGVITLEASCARYIQRGWSKEAVEEQIASQNPVDWITSYSKLDLDSVMAYATSGAENILLELKHELSDMDKAFMVINYPRSGERKNFVYPRGGGGLVEVDDRAWTMEHALDIAGLSEAGWADVRKSILTRYANLNAARTNEIREIFGDWTKARREEERVARAARRVADAAKVAAG